MSDEEQSKGPDDSNEPKVKRWGRDANYKAPSALEKIGDGVGEKAEEFSEAAENLAEAATDTAKKAGHGFGQLLTGIANVAIAVGAGVVGFARFVPYVAKSYPKRSAVVLAGVGISSAVAGYMHLMDPETHLNNRDADYKDKCFTFNQASDIKAQGAEESTALIINMLRQFNSKGTKTADKLINSNAIYCFGLNNTEQTEHWSRTNVYLSPHRYPEQLSALFYAKADFDTFWNVAYKHPANINQFTVESGLIFSRATRAMPVIEQVSNLYRAIDSTSPRHNHLISTQWEEFLKDNPTFYKTSESYIKSMKKESNEEVAMREALKTYMTDSKAVNEGDIAYLNRYVDHVRILSQSSYEYIYGQRGLGFFVRSPDYAFVDADRNGNKDDLVTLERSLIGLSYTNQAVSYKYNTTKSGFYRKEEDYDCSYTDTEGNYISDTCQQDRHETVHYKQIPAADTATLTLNSETLAMLADKTESKFLFGGEAEHLINQVMTDSNNKLLYAAPYSPEASKLLERIHGEVAKNIPDHKTALSTKGYGLR